MSDESLYYQGWPYNAQPTPEDIAQSEQDAEIHEVCDMSPQELEELRGLLVRACQSNFAGSTCTVDELFFAIDMTIGVRK